MIHLCKPDLECLPAMEPLVERIGAAERVAVDTEADSLHKLFRKGLKIVVTGPAVARSGSNHIQLGG